MLRASCLCSLLCTHDYCLRQGWAILQRARGTLDVDARSTWNNHIGSFNCCPHLLTPVVAAEADRYGLLFLPEEVLACTCVCDLAATYKGVGHSCCGISKEKMAVKACGSKIFLCLNSLQKQH